MTKNDSTDGRLGIVRGRSFVNEKRLRGSNDFWSSLYPKQRIYLLQRSHSASAFDFLLPVWSATLPTVESLLRATFLEISKSRLTESLLVGNFTMFSRYDWEKFDGI